MNGTDILVQQAIIAAYFWSVVCIYAQQKWRLFNTFLGKKYGPVVAVTLYILAWLQVLATLVIALRSSWTMPGLPILGILLVAGSLYSILSNKKSPFSIKVQYKFLNRMALHIPYALLLLGLGLVSGSLGMLLGSVTYTICAVLQSVLLGRAKLRFATIYAHAYK